MKIGKKRKTEEVSSLQSFSDIIAQQAAEQRQRDEEELTRLQFKMNATKRKIRSMIDTELLEYFITIPHSNDPRFTVLYNELSEAAKVEILKRMAKT